MMNYYWAEFKEIGQDIFRLDTRIYLNHVENIEDNHFCIGAVVGKNPGSAKSTNINKGISSINLDGDKLLPTVRNIILKSYIKAGIQIPRKGYIQVLNLFYLCNPNLNEAILAIEKSTKKENCLSEDKTFPWIWYLWGKELKSLNKFKERFSKIKTDNHLFFDKEKFKVINKQPSITSFAKHTQGLKHELIIPGISQVLKLHF